MLILEHKDKDGNVIHSSVQKLEHLINGDVLCYDSRSENGLLDMFQWNIKTQEIEHVRKSGEDVKLMFVDFD